MRDFIAKQQRPGHELTQVDSQAVDAEDEIDSQHAQQTAVQDTKALNASLSKLAQKEEMHLIDQAHLLELLGVLDGQMQKGETLLVDHDHKASARPCVAAAARLHALQCAKFDKVPVLVLSTIGRLVTCKAAICLLHAG